MEIAELDFGRIRTRGRAKAPTALKRIRELGEADLALLASSRESVPPPLTTQLRERHHALARCLAQGMADGDCSAVTGYSLSRISILKHDPSFIELLAHYRKVENSLLADFTERATQVSMTALDIIADRLEADPDTIPLGQALEIVKQMADRTGHAPVQKSVNLNANVDLGNRLASARKRLSQTLTVTAVEVVDE